VTIDWPLMSPSVLGGTGTVWLGRAGPGRAGRERHAVVGFMNVRMCAAHVEYLKDMHVCMVGVSV
jgi:hypothetical protein